MFSRILYTRDALLFTEGVAEIPVRVGGNPEPRVRWFKGSRELFPSHRYTYYIDGKQASVFSVEICKQEWSFRKNVHCIII